jgi:chitosanase
MELAQNENIKSALGMCVFYDCIIQHGDGNDLDSIEAIIKRTESKKGGSFDGNVEE